MLIRGGTSCETDNTEINDENNHLKLLLKEFQFVIRSKNCLPCSYTNDVIDLLPLQLCHVVSVTSSGCQSVKVLRNILSV